MKLQMFEIGTLLLPFQIKLALRGLGGIIFNEKISFSFGRRSSSEMVSNITDS